MSGNPLLLPHSCLKLFPPSCPPAADGPWRWGELPNPRESLLVAGGSAGGDGAGGGDVREIR